MKLSLFLRILEKKCSLLILCKNNPLKNKKRMIDESLVQPTVYYHQYIYTIITNSIIVKQTGIEKAQQVTETDFQRVLVFTFWETSLLIKFIYFKNITNSYRKFGTVVSTF